MKTKSLLLLTALTCATTSHLCLAGKGTELTPTLAKPGKLLVEDSFAAPELAKTWTVAKGEWVVRDGAVVGKIKKEDNHPAVFILTQPNRNSLIRFSFKLEDAKGFSLSYNSAKGHLFRVSVAADGLTINKDKDKKDPDSKGLVLGKADAKFESSQWYTMLVEIKGDKVAVQTDNGVKIEASNPELDVDKLGYRFVTPGEALLLGDIKVWEAAP
jgi:hypothetical protein